jgi:hypothetical protein
MKQKQQQKTAQPKQNSRCKSSLRTVQCNKLPEGRAGSDPDPDPEEKESGDQQDCLAIYDDVYLCSV